MTEELSRRFKKLKTILFFVSVLLMNNIMKHVYVMRMKIYKEEKILAVIYPRNQTVGKKNSSFFITVWLRRQVVVCI